MPRIIIDDTVGIKVVQGSGGVEIASSISSGTPSVLSVGSLTADSTLTTGGVFTVSSSTGAVTTTLPLASAVPGATMIFRATSAHAHALTGSQETNGTLVFCGLPGASVANSGSKLALPAVVGSSVSLVSDGKSYLVHALSGSCTISGT